MIEAEKLRVGNKILSAFDKIETVRAIHGHEGFKHRKDVHKIYKYLVMVEENLNQYNLAEIKPIEVTAHLLREFRVKMCHRNDEGIGPIHISGDLYIAKNGLHRFNSGKWVHEINMDLSELHVLQNVYFYLKGEELIK